MVSGMKKFNKSINRRVVLFMVAEAVGNNGCSAGRVFLSGINDISCAVVFQVPDDQGLLTNGSDLPEP